MNKELSAWLDYITIKSEDSLTQEEVGLKRYIKNIKSEHIHISNDIVKLNGRIEENLGKAVYFMICARKLTIHTDSLDDKIRVLKQKLEALEQALLYLSNADQFVYQAKNDGNIVKDKSLTDLETNVSSLRIRCSKIVKHTDLETQRLEQLKKLMDAKKKKAA